MTEPKIMILDIEASNLSANFGHMISFGYKWLGAKEVYVKAINDFKGFKKNHVDDEGLVRWAAGEMTKADIWVTWYGKGFDIPYIQTRCLKHKIGILPETPHVDGWAVAKYKMRMTSNRLESVATFLGVSSKTHLDGNIWDRAAAGYEKDIKYIVKHNKEDVLSLERVYKIILPLISTHPNVNMLTGRAMACPNCGSKQVQSRGWRVSRARKARRLQCQKCGSWSKGPSMSVAGVDIR